MTLKTQLQTIRACQSSITWAGRKSFSTAWATCPYQGWMIWLLRRVGYDDALVTSHYSTPADKLRALFPASEVAAALMIAAGHS